MEIYPFFLTAGGRLATSKEIYCLVYKNLCTGYGAAHFLTVAFPTTRKREARISNSPATKSSQL
jgi:hypothetical protein